VPCIRRASSRAPPLCGPAGSSDRPVPCPPRRPTCISSYHAPETPHAGFRTHTSTCLQERADELRMPCAADRPDMPGPAHALPTHRHMRPATANSQHWGPEPATRALVVAEVCHGVPRSVFRRSNAPPELLYARNKPLLPKTPDRRSMLPCGSERKKPRAARSSPRQAPKPQIRTPRPQPSAAQTPCGSPTLALALRQSPTPNPACPPLVAGQIRPRRAVDAPQHSRSKESR